MTIALLPRRADRFGRFARVREIVASLPVRKVGSQPVINAGRWTTLPGEYDGPWACPLDVRLPAVTTPGATAPIMCGADGAVVLHLAGTWRGHVIFEGSLDGRTWRRISLRSLTDGAIEGASDGPGLWRTLPDQRVAYLRLAIADLSHGTLLASVSAASSAFHEERHPLDSAA